MACSRLDHPLLRCASDTRLRGRALLTCPSEQMGCGCRAQWVAVLHHESSGDAELGDAGAQPTEVQSRARDESRRRHAPLCADARQVPASSQQDSAARVQSRWAGATTFFFLRVPAQADLRIPA